MSPEMRFNPIVSFLNSTKFTHFFMRLTKLPGWHGELFFKVAMWGWFWVSWLALPVPVKLTLVVGEPIRPVVGTSETVGEFADRCRYG